MRFVVIESYKCENNFVGNRVKKGVKLKNVQKSGYCYFLFEKRAEKESEVEACEKNLTLLFFWLKNVSKKF